MAQRDSNSRLAVRKRLNGMGGILRLKWWGQENSQGENSVRLAGDSTQRRICRNIMKYGSVCSGIEAASVAWHHLGWEAQWFSEIEHFPSEVLKYRYPTVENLGDMTKLTTNETFKASTIDLLVGGTPCQSFSVAGLRRGLADPRGNLMPVSYTHLTLPTKRIV